jgi:phosphonate transport system ATP-binding protein
MATPLVRIRDLSVTYSGGVDALQGISLDVSTSEITVLLGRSGAGKSTLLRCINRLQVPTHGSIWVDGIGSLEDPGALRDHRRATGMVFQHHHLIEQRTALANVLIGRVGHRTLLQAALPASARDLRLAFECLDRVGIAHKAMVRADRLSGGERQRVGIARALAQQPRLLLADEPVASLDPATADAILVLLTRVTREDGLTAVFSLHQVDLARRFADRIVGIAHGRVVFDGRPGELGAEALNEIYFDASIAKGVSDAALVS